MKILLTMNLPWFPAVGGANKCNRALAEGLAARGHTVRAVVPALAVPSRWTREEVRTELRARGIEVRAEDGADVFWSQGVEVVSIADPARLRGELTEHLRGFAPDRILASSEDPSQNLLDAALKAQAAPVIYLSHTPAFLPFGPQAFYSSERRSRMLSQVAGIVAVSRFVAEYIRRWGGLEAAVFPFPIYGPGPFPNFGETGGTAEDGFVTLINPCAVKGIAIFLELARSLPDVRFAAVPTWGTTPADREALAALSNVTLLPPADDIDRIYERTRVLLMPSLWEEAFGVTAVEAMLRGIPVLASAVGGLPEAKLGTDFVLPVLPIERFTDRQDANAVAEPVVPTQDIGPWRDALVRLLDDRELYARQSATARSAAHRFVAGLGVEPFEELMERMHGRTTAAPAASPAPAAAGDDMASLTPEQRALLMLRLRKKAAQKSPEEGGLPSIPRRPATLSEKENLPLSFAQQRLWFLDQWHPGNPVYNLPAAVRLRGPLDVPAFAGALREIVRRHEALRTSFPAVDGTPVQVISPEPVLEVPLVDLAGVPAAVREPEIRRLIEAEARAPFDLAAGPLVRASLLRTHDEDDAEHVAVVNLHHIVADGWSIGVLIRELALIYGAWRERRPHGLPPLPVQYADFAVWQRGWLQGEELERQLGWWRERLAGMPPVLEIPADRPRPAVPTFRGGRRPVHLDAELWAAVRSFSLGQGATPFMTALAAFLALLGRVSSGTTAGQTDVAVGSPIANRNRQETEGLIGFFVNTLVLRADLGGDPGFRELLARVREATLGAYAHQDLPFEEVVKEVAAGRDLSHNPLFQIMFALHNTPEAAPRISGVDLSFFDLYSGTAKFDFDLMAMEQDGGLGGAVEHSADLFDAPTVDRLLAHWETLLRAALAAPDLPLAELPLLGAGERQQILVEWNDTGVDFPRDVALHDLFAARAEAAPEAPAVIAPEESLTYAELRGRALELAARLRALGVLPGDRVGICVERSPWMITGLVGIAMAGGAYVPLDPAYPAARLALMAEDARVRVVVTETSPPTPLPSPPHQPGEGRHRPGLGAEGPAYLIYTSGSTGTPKGVMVDHRGRVNNFLDFDRRFQVGPGDRLLAVSALGFDMTAYDVFGTLAAGAAIVLPRAADALDPARWAELMIRERVTLWHSAPALLELLVQHLEAQPPGSSQVGLLALRVVLLGGDWIPLSLPDRIRRFAPGATVISLGGATEVSMDSTIYRIDEVRSGWRSIPYGRPMWNQTAWVVDAALRPQPIGVPGELLLGGAGVGHGYFGKPDLTAERFIPNPFCDRTDRSDPTDPSDQFGGRLYRTGDLARFRPDGQLELLGRIDFQVKVRGVRIELGEIMAALSRHEAVQEAVVVARPDASGRQRLIGYVVPRHPVDTAELASFLEARLPRAMVPAAWVFLDALPLSPNGKVDRRALPDPAPQADRAARAWVEPRTAVEAVIAGVWSDLLGVERVGAEDNFFELGGHSLLATQAVSRLRSLLQIELPLRALLESPTVAGTAAAVVALAGAEGIDLEEIAATVLQIDELSEDDVLRLLEERAAQERAARERGASLGT